MMEKIESLNGIWYWAYTNIPIPIWIIDSMYEVEYYTYAQQGAIATYWKEYP